jgi:putative alpha-1,2-mannosidase
MDASAAKKLVVNMAVSNERIRDWKIEQDGGHAFKGYQQFSEKIYFYAVSNYGIQQIERLKGSKAELPVVDFETGSKPVEIRIGFSFVSTENAKENLEKELGAKSFETVKAEANATALSGRRCSSTPASTARSCGLLYAAT